MTKFFIHIYKRNNRYVNQMTPIRDKALRVIRVRATTTPQPYGITGIILLKFILAIRLIEI